MQIENPATATDAPVGASISAPPNLTVTDVRAPILGAAAAALPPTDAELAAIGTDDDPGAAVIDHAQLRHSALLYSNFRTGSHFLKLTLAKLAAIEPLAEVLNPYQSDAVGALTFKTFLGQRADITATRLFMDPHGVTHEFVTALLAGVKDRRPAIVDLKYSQAATLGMDDTPTAPRILAQMVRMGLPVIHLVRRDVVAQALSLLVAQQTNVYVLATGAGAGNDATRGGEKFWFDPKAVLSLSRNLASARSAAQLQLTGLGSRTMTVFYEDLLSEAGLRDGLKRCLRAIDIFADLPEQIKPMTQRQNSLDRVANLDDIHQMIAAEDMDLAASCGI